jgi:hypothetical protein
MSLVNAYARYYRSRDLVALENLFEALVSYDFQDFEETTRRCFELLLDAAPDSEFLELKSNGSTKGRRRHYKFGPMAGEWLWRVEQYLRSGAGRFKGPEGSIIAQSIQGEYFSVTRPNLQQTGYSPRLHQNLQDRDFVVTLNPHDDDCFQRFADFLTGEEKTTWLANPMIWLAIFSSPARSNLVAPYVTAAVSTFDLPFFRGTSVVVNDQMASWMGGFNFWTCEGGERHCLPTFHVLKGRCFNLLNLAAHVGDDADYISVGSSPVTCRCGKPRLPFRFVGHYRNSVTSVPKTPNTLEWIDTVLEPLDLANELESPFTNIQFVQEGKTLHVAYVCRDIVTADFNKMESAFPGFELKSRPGAMLRVGYSKKPPFWCMENPPFTTVGPEMYTTPFKWLT